MRLSKTALTLALLLALAALCAPLGVDGAKKAAKKAAAAASKIGVLDTDEDDADGGPADGYGDLGWITVAEYKVT